MLVKPRKILSSNYSFLVTLPKEWLKHHEIGRGDFLNILTDAEGNLVLKPIKEMKKNDRDDAITRGTGAEVSEGNTGI